MGSRFMSDASNSHDNRVRGDSQPQETLEGTLDRVNWSAPDSAFLVARFRVADELFPVVIVGEMLSPSVGDRYLLRGTWEEHPKYGRQFAFTSYETQMPVTEEGLVRFLASGMLRGIGKSTAGKIVARFGLDTLQVLNGDIGRLREIDGIGEKKLEGIRTSWQEQRGVQTVMLFLREHDISTSWAVRIFHVYGVDAVRRMREDPYRLVDDVEGIGFKIADGIARSLGMESGDTRRVAAGLIWVLREAARRDGHTAVPADHFLHHAAAVLEVDEDQVSAALREVRADARLIEEDGMLFLPDLYAAEQAVAQSLFRAHAEQWNGLDHLAIDELLTDVERAQELRFNAQQVDAIHRCLGGPLCVVTGGPGTGKTTTLTGILHVTRALGWKAAVCAPTGRAAKRITEITGCEARTIHRLLEFEPVSGFFQRNEDKPVEADILVVDEVSMVDVPLMAALLRARPPGCRVVLVGDADQLPSIGPGAVLRDMISCGEIDTVVLRLVFRQEAQSSIVSNAHRVREGFMPVFDARLADGGETFFREVGPDENIAQLIRDLIVDRLPETFSLDPMRDIQVLSPMHNTPAGVTHLNHVLQQAVNGGGRVVYHHGDRRFRAGDKVMQIRNDYEKDVYNGDIGFVHGFDEEESRLAVDFDRRRVEYSAEEMEHLVLAYAVTIHKSQGSEYPVVIVPMVMQHRIMLRRTLLYTAMTRARRMLIMLGQRAAVATAVQSPNEKPRYGRLRDRLRETLR
ncbi:MAG: ATP-dependent RecD-like DNA helicase [Bacteroidota bacterium]|nr:ATP-dependent RecD-like DNA helicase [Bacteroidota bacterium]